MTAAIEFSAVRMDFTARGRHTRAIEDIGFRVLPGEYVCVVGRSGAGKSTAANLILGLLAPTAGRVRVLGADPAREFDALRGRIACVFQQDRLLPWRTALGNARLPLEIIGADDASLTRGAAEWLDRLGLAGFHDAYPHELSGGMRQRVALARALVCDPDIIIADESFASLDALTGEALRREFLTLVKSTGKTVLHVTHSIDEALALADRILVFARPGRVADDIAIDRREIGPETGPETGPRPDDRALRARILQAMDAPAGRTEKAITA